MPECVAIVTGGLRGLGRAMTLGLLRTGWRVLAVGHIAEDVVDLQHAVAGAPFAAALQCLFADLRDPRQCELIVRTAQQQLNGLHVLINNAGLTFTYVDPDRFEKGPRKFWTLPDDVVQTVMDVNYVAADQMTRRVAPLLIAQGWGRIINVTTKLSTMNAPGSVPYGPSKAALEIATEIWSKELAGSGVTANIINPGAGADTPGMGNTMRERSARGEVPPLVKPEEMVPPLLFMVSREADAINGYRFDANAWDLSLPPAEAARRSGRRAGFDMRPQSDCFAP